MVEMAVEMYIFNIFQINCLSFCFHKGLLHIQHFMDLNIVSKSIRENIVVVVAIIINHFQTINVVKRLCLQLETCNDSYFHDEFLSLRLIVLVQDENKMIKSNKTFEKQQKTSSEGIIKKSSQDSFNANFIKQKQLNVSSNENQPLGHKSSQR